jgi:hypothetical protein
MQTHRELYPDQYTHPLVGRRVVVRTRAGGRGEGVVERVVSTRFGLLAILDGDATQAWRVDDCTPIKAKGGAR